MKKFLKHLNKLSQNKLICFGLILFVIALLLFAYVSFDYDWAKVYISYIGQRHKVWFSFFCTALIFGVLFNVRLFFKRVEINKIIGVTLLALLFLTSFLLWYYLFARIFDKDPSGYIAFSYATISGAILLLGYILTIHKRYKHILAVIFFGCVGTVGAIVYSKVGMTIEFQLLCALPIITLLMFSTYVFK